MENSVILFSGAQLGITNIMTSAESHCLREIQNRRKKMSQFKLTGNAQPKVLFSLS